MANGEEAWGDLGQLPDESDQISRPANFVLEDNSEEETCQSPVQGVEDFTAMVEEVLQLPESNDSRPI
jgi:hypothetical protein